MGPDASLEVVEDVRVGGLADDGLVVRPEALLHLLGGVGEVEDEGVVLTGVGVVEAGQRLDGLEALELLIDVHGVQERLVEARLVLLCHHQHLVLVAVKLLR